MNVYGAEAIELEEALESPRRANESQPSFEVVTGGGLDSRVRAGVSSEFLARVKAVVAAAVLIFILGSIRVALTSLTVSVLSENAQMREQISTFETNNDNLRVERSLMASATRIDRIATQNYGMVAPETFDVVVIMTPEREAAEAAAAEEAAAAAAAAEAEAQAQAEAEAEAEAETESEDGVVFDATQLATSL